MPFTPFHFGPGAALKAVCPGYFSLSLFCGAQAITDLESGYYLLRGEYPVHRWAHTYAGAVLVGLITAVCLTPIVRWWHRRSSLTPSSPLRAWIKVDGPSWRVALGSALIGTFSHVFLDSIMHADAHPLRPFTDQNALLGLVSLRSLHLFCVVSGVFALAYAAFTESKRTKRSS